MIDSLDVLELLEKKKVFKLMTNVNGEKETLELSMKKYGNRYILNIENRDTDEITKIIIKEK